MFKQTILYYVYPPFDSYIDDTGVTILSRYIYANPFKTSKNEYGISFNVEEKCEVDNGDNLIPFFRTVHSDIVSLADLPQNMHLSVIALAENQVFGATAETFIKALFVDIFVANPKVTWIHRYFSKWAINASSEKTEVFSELLDLQRRIRNGEFNDR